MPGAAPGVGVWRVAASDHFRSWAGGPLAFHGLCYACRENTGRVDRLWYCKRPGAICRYTRTEHPGTPRRNCEAYETSRIPEEVFWKAEAAGFPTHRRGPSNSQGLLWNPHRAREFFWISNVLTMRPMWIRTLAHGIVATPQSACGFGTMFPFDLST